MPYWANWAQLSRAKLNGSPSAATHQEICTCEKDIEAIHVFSNAPINYFSVTKKLFYDKKWMLNLAPYGRFAMFHFFIPVNSLIFV